MRSGGYVVKAAVLLALLTSATRAGAPDVGRQICTTVTQAEGTWTLELTRTAKRLSAVSLSASQESGTVVRACGITATSGDGRSRFAETAKAAFVRVEGDDGLARLSLLYADPKNGIGNGEMMLSIAGKGDAPAACGSFVVPPTFIVVTSGKSCRLQLAGE